MLSKSFFKINNIQKRIVFYIVAITVPMFIVSLYLIQDFVSERLEKSEYRQAQLINLNTLKEIERFIERTGSFTEKAAYMITANPEHFEKVLPYLKEHVKKDSSVFGSALALEPGILTSEPYCEYFYKRNGKIKEISLLPPEYDYLHKSWYADVKKSKTPVWSEPYFDKGGGNIYMSTFSYPVKDLNNRFLGIVTADVALNTLSKAIQKLAGDKSNRVFLVSKQGFLLSSYDSTFNLKKTIFDYAGFLGSDELKKAGSDMVRGVSGVYKINLKDGNYTLYTMFIPETSWTIGILMKNSVLFEPLNKLKKKLLFIMLADILLILVMVLIVSNRLKKNVAREEKIKNEFILASRIQQQFLPEKSDVTTNNFSLSGVMKPAKEVGGDFYGYKIIEDKIMFYVGDVSGKGVPASLFMMASQMLIEDAIDEQFDPAYVLNKVNRKLSKISTTGMFATMIIGMLNLKNNEFTFSVAGHPPFIINSNGAVFSPVTRFAPPVATFGDFNYQNSSIILENNSTIIAFSDGVSEAENSKKELFGTEPVARILQDISGLTVSEIKERLLRNIQQFTAGAEQNDDITIVVVSSSVML